MITEAHTTLVKRCWRSSQGVEYHEVLKLSYHTLQIRIDRDSYEMQSHAVIERWDGVMWHRLAWIPYALMHTPYTGCDAIQEEWFETDVMELIDLARTILD